jgi:release factor glutamine methyltransferase
MTIEPRISRTIAQALAEAAQTLQAAGISDERLTANVLLGHILGLDRAQLLVNSNAMLDQASDQTFFNLIERRVAGEPLQYITGHQEFYGLDFKVTPDVLIPRPETEFLVEQVINLAQSLAEQNQDPSSTPHHSSHPPEFRIVDVGTGSGCIAVALAHHLKNVQVLATDISRAALAVARENAGRHQVESQIEFLEGDLFAPLAGRGLESAIDFIVSNPPYIPLKDLPALQREVRDFEPYGALFADEDGLRFYKRLLDEGHRYLTPGGYLVCEIGYAQLEPIQQLINASTWKLEAVTHDLQGIARTLTICKTL